MGRDISVQETSAVAKIVHKATLGWVWSQDSCGGEWSDDVSECEKSPAQSSDRDNVGVGVDNDLFR